MNVINILKKSAPKWLKISYKVSNIYWYDYQRFIKHSNIYQKFETANKLKGKLTIYNHVVEKGLTMPNTKLGFGTDVINELIGMCFMYIDKGYDLTSLEFIHTVNVLKEYVEYHVKNTYQLNEHVVAQINAIAEKAGTCATSKQLEFSANQFFKESNSAFDKFCLSRYSIRNYTSEEVPLDTLQNCIELAQKTPSSCNRQPNRVYIVKSPDKVKGVLSLQHGNRGFGHLASTLLIVTSDISVFQGTNDRNESYINSGMFSMSLIYALHFHKIGACPLNWSVDSKIDSKLRALLEIPDNERISLVISCGFIPEEVKVAASPRLNWSEITKIV